MGCPCKNPPGSSSKKVVVVRNPMTLKPLDSDAPLSREDIRAGRTRRVGDHPLDQDPIEPSPPRYVFRRVSRKPMGGFLSDTIRNLNR